MKKQESAKKESLSSSAQLGKEFKLLSQYFITFLCSSECDKMPSLPVFYVDKKFTHQVIYFNTKSSIFYVKVKMYTSSLLHQVSVVHNLLIKFLALISSFLYLYGIQFSPCLHNFVEGIKNIYMSSLQFHKSRRPGNHPVKRAWAVWKLHALKFNMAVAMNFFPTWWNFLKLFCRRPAKAAHVWNYEIRTI